MPHPALSPLLVAAVLALSSSSACLAQPTSTYPPPDKCSCSPRRFRFKLDLAADCPPLPPPFPPNDVFSGGVKDYTCTIGPEPIPQVSQAVTSDDTSVGLVLSGYEDYDSSSSDTPSTRTLGDAGNGVGKVYETTAADYFPEILDTGETDADQQEWNSTSPLTTSSLAIDSYQGDLVPVSVYSIQFLEVDGAFNVINQDSTYVRGIDLGTGDAFEYASIAARGAAPGGMNVVLRGANAGGEPVRNTFLISYADDCGVPTFREGDAIGWVVFESFEPASEEACGAPDPTTTPPSTRSPSKPTTTPNPTRKPSSRPTKKPTGGSSTASSSKSSKSSDGSKSSKSSKVSKFAKSKSSKKSKEAGSVPGSSGKGSKAKYSKMSAEDGVSSHRSPKVAKRRRRDNGPIRARGLAAADTTEFVADTPMDELELDGYFLLDRNNDRKEEKGVRSQQKNRRHLGR